MVGWLPVAFVLQSFDFSESMCEDVVKKKKKKKKKEKKNKRKKKKAKCKK